jgi:hypothetical protein
VPERRYCFSAFSSSAVKRITAAGLAMTTAYRYIANYCK